MNVKTLLEFRKILKKYSGAAICLALAFILLPLSRIVMKEMNDEKNVASKVERKLASRMNALEQYISDEISADADNWEHLEKLPDDIILYHYSLDTLHSWHNEFPVLNDDIRDRFAFNVMVSESYGYTSQLCKLDTTFRFADIGQKCYIARIIRPDLNTKIVAALEIASRGPNGDIDYVSPNLRLPKNFHLESIGGNFGTPVYYGDMPVFLVCHNTAGQSTLTADKALIWAAMALFVIAAIYVLRKKRSPAVWAATVSIITIAYGLSYLGSKDLQGTSLFSASIFADGPFWPSLGNLLLMCIYIGMLALCSYMMRRHLLKKALEKNSRGWLVAYGAILILTAAAIIGFIFYSFRSLILNSSLPTFLQTINHDSIYQFLTLFIYSLLFGTIMLKNQMLKPVIRKLSGIRLRNISTRTVILYALILSVSFFFMIRELSLKREEQKIQVWANRMSIERDLGTELLLRSVENAISEDSYIPLLIDNDPVGNAVHNWVVEKYLYRISKTYDIRTSLYYNDSRGFLEHFNDRMEYCVPIAEDSHFMYCENPEEKCNYSSIFMYFTPGRGLVRLVVDLSLSSGNGMGNFRSIFSNTPESLSGVSLPKFYSYAKYKDGRQTAYKGAYSYSTVLEDKGKEIIESGKHSYFQNGYIHFVNSVTDDEVIIISRPTTGTLANLSMLLLLNLISFCSMEVFLLIRKRGRKDPGNSFIRRISTSLLVTFIISLTCLVAVSVKFVYDRNKADIETLLSNRLNTIVSTVESTGRQMKHLSDMNIVELKNTLEAIARNTDSEISLYSIDGKVYVSSIPEVYTDLYLSSRIDNEAYYNIKFKHSRSFRKNENFHGRKYIDMYAPVLNSNGNLLAILYTPYTGVDNIMADAIPHSILLIVIAIMLIVVSQIFISKYAGKMFGPLSEVSRRMEQSNIHSLQYIIYRPNDEISKLVNAYNRMVHDLSESTRELARSERDKAWSEMARQVAHEIKNPLTPIKLEIQRLIRLKQKNDGAWENKFDHVSGIILEHIDMLTDTANEFSTFAKLYDQEPVEMNLDAVLEEQITIFDNRDNITISYMGLKDAVIYGPKPQLVRVFVNLLTNAIQAIEINQKENSDNADTAQGRILVCLRKSAREDCYDIAIEDNGPGVRDENLSKLFTPNFTTKSGGTGLGLAICHNIIERCHGSISYRKSFSLGGACFTITLPKGSASGQ